VAQSIVKFYRKVYVFLVERMKCCVQFFMKTSEGLIQEVIENTVANVDLRIEDIEEEGAQEKIVLENKSDHSIG